jgi:hypothetical protein
MNHGTPTAYNRGCRCITCAKANTRRCTRNRVARIAERVTIAGREVHPRALHGTDNGYLNYYCRCKPCVAAGSKRNAANRERRRAAKECAA